MKNTGLITREYVNTVIKERPEDIHKGQCGRVVVVAGSVGMAGAAILSARGALKSGAGLVKIAAPSEIFNILQSAVPQATCTDVSKGLTQGFLDGSNAVAIGPGLGVDESKYLLIEEILREYNGPIVLDADGINCVCKYSNELEVLKSRKAPTILTPHVGEGDRLLKALDKDPIKVLGRENAAEIISEEIGAIVLLKGPGTVVTTGVGKTYTNTTGNPGMATGGSGDVLTGVITAFAASGINPFDATKAGAFVHGLAGDFAADKYGQWGMTSVEIEESLPFALKSIVGK